MEAGSVTQYWYANRVVDLAQGAIAVGVGSALLPAISQAVADEDWERFREDFARAVRLAALVLVPAAAMLLALAEPIVSVLFLHGEFDQGDADHTALTLVMMVPFMLAIAGINIVKKVFFAVDDRNTLLAVGGAGVVVTGGVGYALLNHLGVEGLGLALSVSTCFQLVIYLVLLRRRLGARIGFAALLWPLVKLCVAAVPATALGWWICTYGSWERGPSLLMNIAILAGGLAAAGFAYLLLCKVLGVRELEDLVQRFRGRLKR
jgi:putative peptidoglycan lipid II flippase